MKVPKTQLHDIASRLRALDIPDAMSVQKTIDALLDDIEFAQQRGYSIRKIAEMLGDDLRVRPTTLANCLARARAKRRERTPEAPTQPAPQRHESIKTSKPSTEGLPRDGSFTPREDRGDI